MKYGNERKLREKGENFDMLGRDCKGEKKKLKERRYIIKFFVQSAVCLLIIGSIIIAKYLSPNTFVSVTSVLNGLYSENITLSDLNALIDDMVNENDALAAFFNFNQR